MKTAKSAPSQQNDRNPNPSAVSRAHTGLEMDSRIAKPTQIWKWLLFGAAACTLMTLVAFMTLDANKGRSFKVSGAHINIASVSSGIFEDFIPVRARVAPLNTVYLDAIEGGRVEKVLIEDGTMVSQGQPIIELSNTNLQLSVMRNEAEVTQQLNNMRTIELQLEQNRLSHRRNLIEIEYQIKKLSRQLERERKLFAQGNLSQSALEDTRDSLEYYQNREAVTLESQTTDMRLQEQQLAFLKDNSKRLEENLEFARANMDKLNVRAPVAGKLSGFNAEVGQSIAPGGRLGQIDDPNNFKLTAEIDEFYLNRVDLDQHAKFELGGTSYELRIAKIYPQVNNGQFEVDMVFVNAQPQDIRRGQSIQTRLTLGDAGEALLIPNGAFYQETGGNWIFVVNAQGTEAVKRNVRLGRRNNKFIEVLDGLDQGERVVTSPYTSYQDIDRLTLSE